MGFELSGESIGHLTAAFRTGDGVAADEPSKQPFEWSFAGHFEIRARREEDEGMVTITRAVGNRNGKDMMPNMPGDVANIIALLDRIPIANGGTAGTPARIWSPDRATLITEVTAAIVNFQTRNSRPTI